MDLGNGLLLWFDMFLVLLQVTPPSLSNDQVDVLVWKTNDGELSTFLVGLAWDSIRPRGVQVPWFRVVWHTHAVPRHSVHLWLIMGRKLMTQDRLRQWDVGESVNLNLLRCPLCRLQPDSHTHLFFECTYSMQVWNSVCPLAGMQNEPPSWDTIIAWIQTISKRNSRKSVVPRLVFDAASYLVWQERNLRIYGKDQRREDQIRDVIIEVVRLKLMSLRFKNTANVSKMLKLWKIPYEDSNGANR